MARNWLLGKLCGAANGNIDSMKLGRAIWPRGICVRFALFAWQVLGAAAISAQTYDFGYVPVGATNKANGFNFTGGSDNGTNKFMATEMFIGANAADFLR